MRRAATMTSASRRVHGGHREGAAHQLQARAHRLHEFQALGAGLFDEVRQHLESVRGAEDVAARFKLALAAPCGFR